MAHDPNRPPHTTNQNVNGGRSGTGIAFIVGILVVVVAVLAYFMFAEPAGDPDVNVSVDAPAAVEDAADDVGDAAAGAADAVGDAAAGAADAVDDAADEVTE